MTILKNAMHIIMSLLVSIFAGILIAITFAKDWPGYIVMGLVAITLIFGHTYD